MDRGCTRMCGGRRWCYKHETPTPTFAEQEKVKEKDGTDRDRSVYTIALHGGDGTQKWAAGAADGDDMMCNIGDAYLCDLGVCVLDSNCRSFRIWDKAGKFVGKASVSVMAGVAYPWPVAMVRAGEVAWMALTHKSNEKDDKNHYGFVMRVDGL